MIANSAITSVIDINHLYYFSNSYRLGLSLVSDVLKDQNYQQWSRFVKIALSAKLKLGFIDQTEAKSAANLPLLNLWMRSNILVILWILNSLSSYIRKNIINISIAKQIWDDLASRYAQE